MAEQEELRDALVAVVGPIVADHGAELVDVELAGSGHGRIVRLLVHQEPAIPIQVCQAISREVGDVLDVEDLMPGRYRLEVTSPGLSRPLKSDRDFARAGSHEVRVVLRSGRTWRGVLLHWSADSVTLRPRGADATEHKLDRDEIAKITIIPEV